MMRALSNLVFAHPHFLWLLLALPVLIWLRNKRKRQAAFVYSSVELVKGVTNISRSSAGLILTALIWMALALMIVAMARPQMTESETTINASGVDIVVALDLSGSMEAEDFFLNRQRVNRLVIAKETLKKFIAKRPNDRIGLVVFAGKAYIASALTLDHDFLLTNLERLNLHTIEDGTAIGSALSASINRLRELKSKSKIVILVTDGQNTAGKIPPLTAAEAAVTLGVKVYTIGVGTHGTAPVPVRNAFGQRVYVQQQVDIDEDLLRKIAQKTGGKYYRADSSETLRSVYAEIDQLEKTEVQVKKFVRRYELFPWLVLPALALLVLELFLANTVWRRLP